MAADFFDDDDTPMAEINVTPLVDVMLVLLITFMITMPVLTHSIGLELPTAAENSTPTPPTVAEPLRLAINQDGYFLRNPPLPVSLQELEAQLRAEKQKNPDIVLAIAADKSLVYEKISDALLAAEQAGIGKIGFETEIDTP